MAAPFTMTTDQQNAILAAYDLRIRASLRSQPMFRNYASVKPIDQNNPGSSLTFETYTDFAVNTTPLDEVTDGNGLVVPENKKVTVFPNEYGNHTILTNRLQKFTFDKLFDASVADRLAFNQAKTLDALVLSKMANATNTLTIAADGSTSTSGAATAGGTLNASAIREARTRLERANVVPFSDGNYIAFVSPEQATDIREETDPAGWRYAIDQVNGAEIHGGYEVGVFEGIRFIKTNNIPKNETTGASTAYFVGQDFLAEFAPDEPHAVIDGTISDPYNRKWAIAWYGIIGWELFRQEAIIAVRTTVRVN